METQLVSHTNLCHFSQIIHFPPRKTPGPAVPTQPCSLASLLTRSAEPLGDIERTVKFKQQYTLTLTNEKCQPGSHFKPVMLILVSDEVAAQRPELTPHAASLEP